MNLKKRKKIAHFIFLSLFGLADEEQQKELEEWFDKQRKNREFFKQLEDPDFQLQQLLEYSGYDERKAWQKLEVRLNFMPRHFFYRLLPYVAVLVLCVGVLAVMRISSSSDNVSDRMEETAFLTSKARLVTEDGHIYELENSGQNDSMFVLAGNNLTNDGRLLVYAYRDTASVCQQHLLQVPRGGEFCLILSDGTRVWLNAETELSYPSYFSGDTRRVKLKGEAYFEVSRDTTMPFIVETGQLQINVLGTSFNVSAYPGEAQHTTLVEGKIRAAYAGQTKVLRPGEQVLLTQEGMKVLKVYVGNYVGWKEKRFAFKNKPIQEVVRDLERWYNIRFVIDPKVCDIRLTASLPKYEHIGEVLKIIEDIACVKCEINSQEIMIKAE